MKSFSGIPLIVLGFVLLAVLHTLPCTAQEKKHYFFRPSTYGSDALFNPLAVLLNGGFDSFQIINDREPKWRSVYWENGGMSVWRSITAPFPVINAFGWKKFLGQEVFPTSLNIDNAQYAPNFMLHTIGGGMVYRKLSEWYDYHNVPLPFVCGAATSIAYEYINEIVENGPNIYPNEDCIADILIFQPLGLVLFSFDNVAEFFSSTLNLNDWSQPVGLSFAPFAIRNAGQNFVMKLALNQRHTTSLFFHFGDFAILGLSLKISEEGALSFGAGLASTGRKFLHRVNEIPYSTVTTGPMAGIYYDRNNSLLASIVYSDVPKNQYRVNVYPGLLSSDWISPGFFLTVEDNGATVFGITARILPIGLVTHFPRSRSNIIWF
jgi:hypothetical protein